MAAAVLIIDFQEILCSGKQASFEVDRVIDSIDSVSRKARAAGALVLASIENFRPRDRFL
jgi:nicotinamidase-related amidase